MTNKQKFLNHTHCDWLVSFIKLKTGDIHHALTYHGFPPLTIVPNDSGIDIYCGILLQTVEKQGKVEIYEKKFVVEMILNLTIHFQSVHQFHTAWL
jgi:hypothetical protein